MVLHLHHVPGRLRVCLARLKGNPRAVAPLKAELLAIEGVETAAIRVHSGSVTIVYDRLRFETEAFWATLLRLGYLDAAPPKALPAPPRPNALASAATAAIAEAVVAEVVKRSAGALIRLLV
jgi:hypothetical protein